MKPPTILRAWEGLGDTIYLRPSIRALAERYDLHVATAWPELLDDLDVRFLRPEAKYRVQRENVARHDAVGRGWAACPTGATELEPRVQWRRRDLSVPAGIADSLGLDPGELVFDLPKARAENAGPYVVVRPVSVREEWPNPARNPAPGYVSVATDVLGAWGLLTISVASLCPGAERPVGPLPDTDVGFLAGELTPAELMGMIADATLVIGGPGWIVPACAAYGTPCLVIGGGHGWYNCPEKLAGPPMDTSRMRWILPDDYCRDCHDPQHGCPKEIGGFEDKLLAALGELGL